MNVKKYLLMIVFGLLILLILNGCKIKDNAEEQINVNNCGDAVAYTCEGNTYNEEQDCSYAINFSYVNVANIDMRNEVNQEQFITFIKKYKPIEVLCENNSPSPSSCWFGCCFYIDNGITFCHQYTGGERWKQWK